MSEPSDPNLPRSQSQREPQGQHQRSSSHLHVTYSIRDSDASSNNNTSNSRSNDNNSSSSKNNNNRRKSILPSEGSDVSTTNAERKSIRCQFHQRFSRSFLYEYRFGSFFLLMYICMYIKSCQNNIRTKKACKKR